MTPSAQQRLIVEWLPRLRQLHHDRRPIRRLMITVLLTPFLFLCIFVARLLLNNNSLDFRNGSLGAMLLGLSALAFTYLGKLQECHDIVLSIELAVIAGDSDLLYKAIAKLTCYGSFRGILDDARRLLPKR
jgi:hypothetical protein